MLVASGADRGRSAVPASAQIAASLSVSSDDKFRSRSLSDGRPIGTFDFSYDDASGFYAGGSATGVDTLHSGAKLLGFQEYIGYAQRTDSGPALDAGLTNARYTHYFSGNYGANYTELYVGIITNHLSTHIRYSPDYFKHSVSTLYADADAVVKPYKNWQMNGHVGALTQISGPRAPGTSRAHYDWRLGVATEVGAFDLRLAWTGAVPGGDYYD